MQGPFVPLFLCIETSMQLRVKQDVKTPRTLPTQKVLFLAMVLVNERHSVAHGLELFGFLIRNVGLKRVF